MGIKKNIIALLLFCLIITIVYAAEQKSYVNINMMNNSIINASWVNASYFNGSGQYLSNLPIGVGNTTTEMRTAINQTLYYNLTSQMCFYLNNATQDTSYTSTYNSTYHDKPPSVFNSSYEYWGNITLTNTYNITYHGQLGHNTTTEIQTAINQTLYYNLTAQMCYYLNNATQDTSYTKTYNSSYLTNSFNASYESQLNHNTTTEIRTAINQTLYYNLTSQMCYYLNNATQDTAYQKTYNSSYLTNAFNASYYLFSNPYGFLNSSYNVTYHPWAYNQTTPAITYVNSNYYNTTASDQRYFSSQSNYYLFNDTSSDVAGYYNMNTTLPQTATTRYNTTAGLTNNQDIIDFINSFTNITFIPQGLVAVHLHTSKTAGTQTLQVYFNLTKRNSTGEFSLAVSEMSQVLSATENHEDIHATIPDTYLVVTDKLVVHIIASVTGAITAPTIQIGMEGTTGSRLEMPSVITIVTTPQIQAAINGTGYYNITSQQCLYLNNATQDTAYTKTYNSSYLTSSYNSSYEYWGNTTLTNTFNSTYNLNISSISNNTLYFNFQNSGFYQNGTEIDTANTTAQMRDAVNQTLYYNLTAQMCFYLNNATQNTLYTQMFNSSYEYWNNASLATVGTCPASQFVKQTTASGVICDTPAAGGGSGVNYWQITGSWMSPNGTAGGQNNINITNLNVTGAYVGTVFNSSYERKPDNNMTYNVTYHGQLGHNTTSEIQIAMNQTLYYNFTSQMCYYLNNATQETSYTKTYNSSYLTSVFNSSYEYWGNLTLTNTYNATYHDKYPYTNPYGFINSTYNATYHNNIDTANTTQQMRDAVNQTLYYNLTSQMCFYLNNATQDTAYTKTYNSSYLTSVFNSSYEYWGNVSLTSTYNSTYHDKYPYTNPYSFINSTYNATYHTYNYLGNTSLVTQADTDWINSTKGMNATVGYFALICLNQTCLSNITKNDTGVYIFG